MSQGNRVLPLAGFAGGAVSAAHEPMLPPEPEPEPPDPELAPDPEPPPELEPELPPDPLLPPVPLFAMIVHPPRHRPTAAISEISLFQNVIFISGIASRSGH